MSRKKQKYTKEKQIIYKLFETVYQKIKKGESKPIDQVYPTLELMKKIGWGVNLLRMTSPVELMAYAKREKNFRVSILPAVKRQLRDEYPDLIIINKVMIGFGLRGYKICASLLDHREEINKRLYRAIHQLQEADYVRHFGSQKFPQLAREYPKSIAPSIMKILPKPAKKEKKEK